MKKAGYSVADEFPIFLLVFAVPAAAALRRLESLHRREAYHGAAWNQR